MVHYCVGANGEVKIHLGPRSFLVDDGLTPEAKEQLRREIAARSAGLPPIKDLPLTEAETAFLQLNLLDRCIKG